MASEIKHVSNMNSLCKASDQLRHWPSFLSNSAQHCSTDIKLNVHQTWQNVTQVWLFFLLHSYVACYTWAVLKHSQLSQSFFFCYITLNPSLLLLDLCCGDNEESDRGWRVISRCVRALGLLRVRMCSSDVGGRPAGDEWTDPPRLDSCSAIILQAPWHSSG